MKLFSDKRETTEGLVFKKKVYELYSRIEFTPEEVEAWEAVKDEIKDHIVAEYSYKGTELNLTIGQLVYVSAKGTGARMAFDSLHERLAAEKEVQAGVAGFSNYLKEVAQSSQGGRDVVEL